MKVRVVVLASLAAALGGCGGTLGGTDPGGAGRAGSSAAAGTTGSGGAAGTGGDAGEPDPGGGAFGEPACLSTVFRSLACTPSDQQLCYKTCGPERTGVKAFTCSTNGTYSEMSGCVFDPNRDYSCYAIPTAANAACPQGITPMAASACEVDHCVLCNSLRGEVGGQYYDSSGAAKVGWCTCQEPNAAGMRLWSCASDTAWPCPLGAGCDAGSAVDGGGGSGLDGGVPGPACASTVAEGAACGPADQQGCFMPCDPGQIGWSAFGCINGAYTVMSNCRPPDGGQ